jgi:hypothetical protein
MSFYNEKGKINQIATQVSGLVSNTIEEYSAAQGQTVVTLVNSYVVGNSEISVEIDGVLQNLGVGYNETDSHTITTTEGLPLGAKVKVIFHGLKPNEDARVATLTSQMVDRASDVNGRGINVLYPPAPLVACVGNGITDDTTKLQNIINSVNNGNIIVQGKLNIKGNTITLKDNVNLIGVDSTSEVIGNIDTLSQSPMLSVGSNSIVRGIKFTNSYAGTSGCITINLRQNAQNTSISECYLQGEETQAIKINSLGIKNILIEKNIFYNVGYGVLLDLNAYDAQKITITNNFFRLISRDAVEINSPILGMGVNRQVGNSAKDIIITNNHIEELTSVDVNSGLGIGIAGATNVIVSNNVILNCSKRSIHVEDFATNIIISNNYCDGGENGIYISKNTIDVSIIGNIIRNFTVNGLWITADATTGTAERIKIHENKFIGGQTGIFINGRDYVSYDVSFNEFRLNTVCGVNINLFGVPRGYVQITDNVFDQTNVALINGSNKAFPRFERNTLLNTKLWDITLSTKYTGKDITFIFTNVPQANTTQVITTLFSNAEVKYFDGDILYKSSDGIINIKALTINGATITKTDKYNNVTGALGALSGSTYSWDGNNKFQVIESFGTAPSSLENMFIQFRGTLFS